MSAETGRTVYFVRHGEAAAAWGQSADPGLSALGHEQAARARDQLLEHLGESRPTVFTSPLLRARETAAPLATHHTQEPIVAEHFREIPSPSPLEGRQEWLRAFMRSRWSEQEGGLLAWRRAMLEALATLPDRAVVFSHFLVLNTLVGAQDQRDETLVFWPANASITIFKETDGGAWSVEPGEQMRSLIN